MSHVLEERLGHIPTSFTDRLPIDQPHEALWFENLSILVPRIRVYEESIDVSSVAANSTSEQAFTIIGITTKDRIMLVNKPSYTADLSITNYRVSAKDTVAIQFLNTSGSPIDPSAETYTIATLRID